MTGASKPASYDDVVGYDALDAFKREAQGAAGEVTHFVAKRLLELGYKEIPESRGESAYLVEAADHILAFVVEGLGTKNLVPERMLAERPSLEREHEFFEAIGQDTAAMILNDMAVAGASPLILGSHVALANSQWLSSANRRRGLLSGWALACGRTGALWGGGETATLRDVIMPGTAVLGGAAVGIIKPKSRYISGNVHEGDAIVLVSSNGVHANGLTGIRDIAERLPDGYRTPISLSCTLGQALCEPTRLYGPLVEKLLDAGVNIHYAIHITGHGWRKLMRLPKPFAYVIEKVPDPNHVIFEFLQTQGRLSHREAYATYNMGFGFALIMPPKALERAFAIADDLHFSENDFVLAGWVKKSRRRQVRLLPKGIVYEEDELNIR